MIRRSRHCQPGLHILQHPRVKILYHLALLLWVQSILGASRRVIAVVARAATPAQPAGDVRPLDARRHDARQLLELGLLLLLLLLGGGRVGSRGVVEVAGAAATTGSRAAETGLCGDGALEGCWRGRTGRRLLLRFEILWVWFENGERNEKTAEAQANQRRSVCSISCVQWMGTLTAAAFSASSMSFLLYQLPAPPRPTLRKTSDDISSPRDGNDW